MMLLKGIPDRSTAISDILTREVPPSGRERGLPSLGIGFSSGGRARFAGWSQRYKGQSASAGIDTSHTPLLHHPPPTSLRPLSHRFLCKYTSTPNQDGLATIRPLPYAVPGEPWSRRVSLQPIQLPDQSRSGHLWRHRLWDYTRHSHHSYR